MTFFPRIVYRFSITTSLRMRKPVITPALSGTRYLAPLTVNSTESRDATQIEAKGEVPFTHLECLGIQKVCARADQALAESAQPRNPSNVTRPFSA